MIDSQNMIDSHRTPILILTTTLFYGACLSLDHFLFSPVSSLSWLHSALISLSFLLLGLFAWLYALSFLRSSLTAFFFLLCFIECFESAPTRSIGVVGPLTSIGSVIALFSLFVLYLKTSKLSQTKQIKHIGFTPYFYFIGCWATVFSGIPRRFFWTDTPLFTMHWGLEPLFSFLLIRPTTFFLGHQVSLLSVLEILANMSIVFFPLAAVYVLLRMRILQFPYQSTTFVCTVLAILVILLLGSLLPATANEDKPTNNTLFLWKVVVVISVSPPLVQWFFANAELLCFREDQSFKRTLAREDISFMGKRTPEEVAQTLLLAFQAVFPHTTVTLFLQDPSTESIHLLPKTQPLTGGAALLSQIMHSDDPTKFSVHHSIIKELLRSSDPVNLATLFPLQRPQPLYVLILPGQRGLMLVDGELGTGVQQETEYLRHMAPLLNQASNLLKQAFEQQWQPKALQFRIDLLELRPQPIRSGLSSALVSMSRHLARRLEVSVEVWWMKAAQDLYPWLQEGTPLLSEETVLSLEDNDWFPYWYLGPFDDPSHLPPALRSHVVPEPLLWLPINEKGILLLHANNEILKERHSSLFSLFLYLAERWRFSIKQILFYQEICQASEILATQVSSYKEAVIPLQQQLEQHFAHPNTDLIHSSYQEILSALQEQQHLLLREVEEAQHRLTYSLKNRHHES